MEKFGADFEKEAEKSNKNSYPIIDDFKIQSRDFKNLTEKGLFAQFAVLKQAEVIKNVSDFLALSENPEFKKLLETLNGQMTLLEALKFLKETITEIDLQEAKGKGLKNLPPQPFSNQIH